VKAASLLAAAILLAGMLIAYHPHPFGWGSPQAPDPCARSSTVPGFNLAGCP
jgi:hypothetical protein